MISYMITTVICATIAVCAAIIGTVAVVKGNADQMQEAFVVCAFCIYGVVSTMDEWT